MSLNFLFDNLLGWTIWADIVFSNMDESENKTFECEFWWGFGHDLTFRDCALGISTERLLRLKYHIRTKCLGQLLSSDILFSDVKHHTSSSAILLSNISFYHLWTFWPQPFTFQKDVRVTLILRLGHPCMLPRVYLHVVLDMHATILTL